MVCRRRDFSLQTEAAILWQDHHSVSKINLVIQLTIIIVASDRIRMGGNAANDAMDHVFLHTLIHISSKQMLTMLAAKEIQIGSINAKGRPGLDLYW
jgi:hypothetical protein